MILENDGLGEIQVGRDFCCPDCLKDQKIKASEPQNVFSGNELEERGSLVITTNRQQAGVLYRYVGNLPQL